RAALLSVLRLRGQSAGGSGPRGARDHRAGWRSPLHPGGVRRAPDGDRAVPGRRMKATILLGTLKIGALSNTATLCEFLVRRLELSGVACETIRLAERRISPGTCTDMGTGDDWPAILETIL